MSKTWRSRPGALLIGLICACLACLGTACGSATTVVRGPAVLGDTVTIPLEKSRSVAEVQAELSDRDALRSEGQYMDTYTFFGHRMEPIRITLESEDLDSYLLVMDGAGNTVAEDDDSGPGLDSQIELMLPADGLYLVVASAFSREQGTYRLRVHRGVATADYSLQEWPAVLEQQFDADSPRDQAGNPFRVYAIRLRAHQTITVEMRSTELNSLVHLHDADAREVAFDDDSAGGLDARLHYTAPADGLYFLVATTYALPGDGQPATYRVHIDE